MDACIPSLSYSLSPVLHGQAPDLISADAWGRLWLVLALPSVPDGSAQPDARWRVVQLRQGVVELDVEVLCPSDALSEVDGLGDGFLLAWARTERDVTAGGTGGWLPNAWVYRRDGSLQGSMTLGDDIMALSVAQDGTIWTTHDEEGLYSGFDGIAGLVVWHPSGQQLISPCDRGWVRFDSWVHALNQARPGEIWFFDANRLCRVTDDDHFSAWPLWDLGSMAFAVHGHDVVVAQRHDPWCDRAGAQALAASMTGVMRTRGRVPLPPGPSPAAPPDWWLRWLRLGEGGSFSVQGEVVLCAADGRAIVPTCIIGQGDRLVVIEDDVVHELVLSDLIGGR